MEESIISNLKIKALIVLLIAVLILTGSAFLSRVNAADEEEREQVEEMQEEEEAVEIKLNRTVKFTGKTYKSYKKNAKVKKDYGEEEVSGLITVIKKGQAHNIYILGKGWISEDQVVSSKKFIDVTIELNDDGLHTGLKIDGEKLDVDIDNTSIIKYEDGELKAVNDGTTNITFTKKDGEEVNVLTEAHDGNITLRLEDKMITGEFESEATVLDKVVIKTDGEGQLALNSEDGVIRLDAEGNGNMVIETTEGQEIATGTIDFNGGAEVDLNEKAVTVEGESHQTLRTLSDKIRIALEEKAKARIDTEKVNVEGDAKAEVNDKELAQVEGEINYNYGDEDPTGRISGSILGREPIEKSGTIPVISTMKKLLKKMPILAK